MLLASELILRRDMGLVQDIRKVSLPVAKFTLRGASQMFKKRLRLKSQSHSSSLLKQTV